MPYAARARALMLLLGATLGFALPLQAQTQMTLENTTTVKTSHTTSLEPVTDLKPLEAFPGSLQAGNTAAKPYERPTVAATQALSEQQTQQLLERLSPLPKDDGQQAFALREGSAPPPKTGETIEASFPPDEELTPPQAPEASSEPLKVLRYQPEGEVPVSGQISISFNQPMVAVNTQAGAVAESVPVKMQPEVAGQWRWMGTRTLAFEPEAARLPMATDFQLSVPAGTESADGQTLAEAVNWTFSTPRLQLTASEPSGSSVGLTPLLFMNFNQRIEPEALMPLLRLQADGAAQAVRLATEAEIQASPQTERYAAALAKGTALILKIEQALPKGQTINVSLLANAPSAEGSRRTEKALNYQFETYSPLAVENYYCGWGQDYCTPDSALTIRFNNELVPEQDLARFVQVEPAIEGMEVQQAGSSSIRIEGLKKGQTLYTVTLAASLQDRFEQSLGEAKPVQFNIGSSSPQLSMPGGEMLILDPHAKPILSFFSINYQTVKVHITRVQPKHLAAYAALMQSGARWQEDTPNLPGETLYQDSYTIDANLDEWAETRMDLSRWLDEGLGHLLVMLEPSELLDGATEQASRGRNRERYLSWVQATQIGLDVYADKQQLTVWTNDLANGAALADTELNLYRANENGEVSTLHSGLRSNEQGLVTFELPEQTGFNWLVATRSQDQAILTRHLAPYSASWEQVSQRNQALWYVMDDRSMYRPGETVHLKGWIRLQALSPEGGLNALPQPQQVNYKVTDSQNNTIAEGKTSLAGLGGFDFKFELPKTPNLGNAVVQLSLGGASPALQASGYQHYHAFQIQEFRTPEFEVSAAVPEGPFVGDAQIDASVEAAYYAGGALPGAPVEWTVSAQPSQYTPPNRPDWQFGFGRPSWLHWGMPALNDGSAQAQFAAETDGSGLHNLQVAMNMQEQMRPMAIDAQATVTDVNRQAWTAAANWLVHPADVYVGLQSERYFVEQGEPLTVDIVTVDLDGAAVSGRPVIVEAGRLRWANGKESLVDVQRCQVNTAAKGLAQCTFKTDKGGRYQITATTQDAQGRRNATRMQRWVAGGAPRPDQDVNQVELQQVQLIPDKDSYQPGDTARLLVQAPFADAEGLLLLGRNGQAQQHRFSIQGQSHTLEIPIRHEWLPNIWAQVTLVGAAEYAESANAQRPAIASGQLNLAISKAERVLDVNVTPAEDALQPGASTAISVQVMNQAGQPQANAEVALVVVDEAILALSNYQLADPLELFYPLRSADISATHSRPNVLLNPAASDAARQAGKQHRFAPQPAPMAMSRAASPVMAMSAEANMMDGAFAGGAAQGAAIEVRSDFNPLAAFVPSLKTDAQGKATAEIELPDNLTRYRIMAVAVHDSTHFGTGEANVTARLPLMVRPSAPRFLNFGDRFEFPVVLQNQTEEALDVQLAMRAHNLELAQAGFAVQVPANERVEVRFPAQTVNAGKLAYQIAAASGAANDAASGELPVWTPATTEAFATYGVIDQGAIRQAIATPEAVWPQFGDLEITTSSTAVQSLTDAYIYLQDYPFTCSEQVASRILATAALRDVLQAFAADGMPSEAELKAKMSADFKALAARQTANGGFALWRSEQAAWPYASVHVVHALVRASYKGYAVDKNMLQRALKYVRTIEQHIPADYPASARQFVLAYSLYVRSLLKDVDAAKAHALLEQAGGPEDLPLEAVGWLLQVLSGQANYQADVQAIRTFLNNRVTETASNAHFVSEMEDGAYLVMHSRRRADGVLLDALIKDQPQSDLIPKLVKGLQAQRTQGRWQNTQENAFILLALDQYFQTFENETPDFVARAWLGEDFVGHHAFKGRTTESHQIDVPMDWLMQQGSETRDLVLDKDGAGRLYYRIGLSYAPKDLDLAAANYGFEVQRRYKAVDDEADVQQQADGSWVIKAGARVEVELELFAPTRRYHVALVDPLPAGLEAINPALAVNAQPENPTLPQPLLRGFWWGGPWYDHQNLRDERAEAFATLLPGGVYTYRYTARATTPGEFVVPPAKAEEMYQPETFGRSASTRVVVQ